MDAAAHPLAYRRPIDSAAERSLQYVVMGLVVTTTLLVGIGARTLVVSVVASIAAGSAYYWTDRRRQFCLPRMGANLLALGAVITAFLATRDADSLEQLLVVAELQAFLQLVLLFQEKTTRLYGQVIMLSVGQAVVAATIAAGLAFGLLLLATATLAIFAGILVLVRRESLAAQSEPLPLGGTTVIEPPPLPVEGAQSLVDPVAGAIGPWPRRAFTLRLPSRAAALTACALVVAAAVFVLAPRASGRRWQPGENPMRMVGFTRTVKLGALGEMVENPDVVFRAGFFRGRSDDYYAIVGAVLYRGVVLDRYERGAWRQSSLIDDFANPPRVPRGADDFVRQEISIEALDEPILFGVFPQRVIRTQTGLLYDSAREQFLRDDESREHRFDYTLATHGFRGGKTVWLYPQMRELNEAELAALIETPTASASQPEPLAGLKALAAQILADAGIDPLKSPQAAAMELNNHFRSSGIYRTSLLPQTRNANADPLEDFVTAHRVGHCEFFAGALAMMLRSVGIPARVVVGFKNGQWNPVGHYYQVRQLDAHAWVEAHLPPEACAGEPNAREIEDALGAWLVLDPTAAVDADTLASLQGGWWSGVKDLAQETWTLYVVGLNAQRQQDAIYQPMAQMARRVFGRFAEPATWDGFARWWSQSALLRGLRWLAANWNRPLGMVAAMATATGFVLLAVAAWHLLRGLAAVVRKGIRKRRRRHREPGGWILSRLECALRPMDLERAPAQTPREFAAAASELLAGSQANVRLAPVPQRIVEAFYGVRFGHRPLEGVELKSLEASLRDLERGLAS